MQTGVVGQAVIGRADGGVLRVTRAGAFALTGLTLGVAAHRLGGGMTPPPWLAASAAAVLFVVALGFTGRQRRLPAITGLVLVTQTAMHVAFALLGGMAVGTGAGEPGPRSGSLLGMVLCHPAGRAPGAEQLAAARGTLASLGVGTPTAAPVANAAFTTSTALMLGAHLLAATGMAWWLARGERAVWRCACRVVTTIRVVLAGVPRYVGRVRLTTLTAAAPLVADWRVLCVPGRAPPVRAWSVLRPVAV